jgi:hypothetical protein
VGTTDSKSRLACPGIAGCGRVGGIGSSVHSALVIRKKVRRVKMKTRIMLLTLLFNAFLVVDSLAQTLPLVYDVENTGADYPTPYLPSFNELPSIQALPDPFAWADGRGRLTYFSDWRYRRAEIGAQIQNYEIGQKPPRPDSITAEYRLDSVTTSYSWGALTVRVTVNGQSLTLTSQVILPLGTGPFPAVIGMNSPSGPIPSSIFTTRNIARITFYHNQVTTYYNAQPSDPFYRLYPNLNLNNTGQYDAWAWGVSRIIDGLELVQDSLPVDLKHLAVAGCSYAGKMALFAGAFDERIALTFAMESGGGGATSWRYSHYVMVDTVEDINNTDYNWFMDSMRQFAGDNVSRLPEDHHELMAMCAPRALYVTANPSYNWLANPSCDVCSRATQQVYNALGIADRFGFSVVGGHSHCQVPSNQIPEIEAFVEKFLLGNDAVSTNNISDSPYNIDLSPWITWTNPTLSNGTSFMGRTTLVSPPNLQKGLDNNLTFTWNKGLNVDKYFIQLSTSAVFADNVKIDSTTDSVKTISDLVAGKTYYWRVREDSAGHLGPWSEQWNFSVYIPLPVAPELGSVTSLHPDKLDSVLFTWRKAQYADKYMFQMSVSSDFKTVFGRDSTADTVEIVRNLVAGATYYWRVQSKNVTGYSDWSASSVVLNVTGVKEEGGIPTQFSISQNYPNPFNPTTRIEFALPKRALTKIVIYDLLGREIQTLINRELEAGYYEFTVDADNLPSGVYFYRVQSGDFTQTKKMILMK